MWAYFLIIICIPCSSSLKVEHCFKDVMKKYFPHLHDVIQRTHGCFYQPFTGVVGTIIATSEATKLSRYAEENSQKLLDNLSTFAEFIPVVGGFIGLSIEKFGEISSEGSEGLINAIIKEIEEQIDSLKVYVDAKIQQLEFTHLSQDLVGILKTAERCADYDKSDQINDLERCLIYFNVRMTSLGGRFMPENDNIIAYDWILPLFRQYADMQLTITEDLVQVARKLNKTSSEHDYMKHLAYQAEEFYNFSVTAVKKLIRAHTTFKGKTCSAGMNWKNKFNPFSRFDGHFGECSQVFFKDRLCKERIIARDAKSAPEGNFAALKTAKSCLNKYARQVKKMLRRDLTKYWNLEIMKSANNWKKIAVKAKKLSNSMINS